MAALVTDSGRRTPARLAGSAVLACQSDERLAALVREGHERAFEAIVARYRRPLVRYCGRILPESRTEDAVQHAFINAHAALVAGDEPAQLKPWLYTITRNAALNLLRQNGWNYEQIPLDFDGVRRPDQVVEQRIELQQTVAAVGALPDRQRDAIVMREFEGRSYEEIAVALGANDGAVRQLLNRARGTLRTAATAMMPPPLVVRVASSLPPSDGRRVAELAGGLGAAGLAKVGATALVAGSLVVGAVNAPLPVVGHAGAKRERATVTGDGGGRASVATRPGQTVVQGTGTKKGTVSSGPRGARRGQTGARKRSGSDDGRSTPRSGNRSGSGERRSGSGDRTESGDRSGSGERSGTDDRSGSAPSGGSDDRSGSRDGSSGTSGSDTSGGGSRDGSGTSGHGSDGGSGTSGSGTSDSGTSGSGTSGSGTSGGGSDDVTTTLTNSGSGDLSGSGGSGSGSDDVSGSGTSGSGSDGSSGSGSGSHGGLDAP